MVKRLRSPSVSGSETASEESSRPARRRRLSGPGEQDHFSDLPLEIRKEIVGHLVDQNDLIGTIDGFDSLRKTAHSVKQGVDKYFNGLATMGDVKTELRVAARVSNKLQDEIPQDNDSSREMAHLMAKAASLPLLRAGERRGNVLSILGYKDSDFHRESLRNVIRNFDYVEPDLRSKVVQQVHDRRKENRSINDLIPELARKANTLSLSERRDLVAASIDISDADTRLSALNAWADKTHFLERDQQRKILGGFPRDSEDYGKLLAGFAGNVDKLAEENRSDLVKLVGALDPDDAYRSAALSRLARHLGVLVDEVDRSIVVDHVLAERGLSPAPVLEDQPPHMQSDFSRLEAIYQLAGHRGLLRSNDKVVAMAVRETLGSATWLEAGKAAGLRAQFIDRVTPVERLAFYERNLSDANWVMPPEVVHGLAARADVLHANERRAFLKGINRRLLQDETSKAAVSYCIGQNFSCFDVKERSFLIKHQVEVVTQHEDPSYAGSALADIAANSKYLQHKDVVKMIGAAKKMVEENIGALPINAKFDASIRACPGHAARCVSAWAQEVLAHPLSHSTSASAGDLRAPISTSSRDDRSRDVSNVR